MPLMSYVPYSRQDLPVYKPKRQKGKYSISKSLLRSTRIRSRPTVIRRSCSNTIPLRNGSAGQGFYFNGTYSLGVACKLDASGFTVSMLSTDKASNTMTTSDIANLYDSYRIKSVTFRFYLNYNTTQSAPNNSEVLPVFVIATDYQDNTVPLTEAAMRENSNHKEFQITQNRYTHKIYPQAVNEVLGATGTAAAVSNLPRKSWLQTANMGVPHYGWKLYMNTIGQNADSYELGSMLITAEYLIELQHVV